jgi:hypothetical protein
MQMLSIKPHYILKAIQLSRRSSYNINRSQLIKGHSQLSFIRGHLFLEIIRWTNRDVIKASRLYYKLTNELEYYYLKYLLGAVSVGGITATSENHSLCLLSSHLSMVWDLFIGGVITYEQRLSYHGDRAYVPTSCI